MGYENRFDGHLDVTSINASNVEIPDDLRTQAEALGLTLKPLATEVQVEDVIRELRESEDTKRFFTFFKYDKRENRIIRNLHATPGSFFGFDKAAQQVAASFYKAGYHLSGDVYRLGEDRDDVERVSVNGRNVEAEQAEVVFKFSDGAVYTPPPL